ncbi:MAG: hypothetical protein A2W99_05880 [Bacteroidetes bacterium GWF2_33_16]|nr:MAG: hypothetical protein A2X00_13015 [Bacteroidetes bacterium GWE2_32_14]OFY05215.1 MAG: hypothetical protein A2W99_05880 [Bacteroidetes bacterium GWF2_33_16]
MLIIQNSTTDPYFNIAVEEYLLKNFTDDCFILYQNKPSIIIGKHQNTLAEINYQYVKENNIAVVRRLSGGGTVYHDLGNLNFSFIKNSGNDKNLVDFKMYTTPIIEVLKQLGVNAEFGGHNDIQVNGFKISGNAEHIFKKRVLHHGTLLFSSDLSILNNAIKAPENRYSDKAVKSVRAVVANIKDFISKEILITELQSKINQFIELNYSDVKSYSFNKYDIARIQELVLEKYATWEWNFGYSPDYDLSNKVKTEQGELIFSLSVEKGNIKSLSISGIDAKEIIENVLVGVKHNEGAVRKTLNKIIKQKNIQINTEVIIKGLF